MVTKQQNLAFRALWQQKIYKNDVYIDKYYFVAESNITVINKRLSNISPTMLELCGRSIILIWFQGENGNAKFLIVK